MNLAPPIFARFSLSCAALFVFVCCSTDPLIEPEAPEEPAPAVEAVVDGLATAVSGGEAAPAAPVTAEIVDVIDGGPAGEWGAKVDFPNGTGIGCYVDVYDKKSDTLLARDEVDSPDESTSHMVRFRYRGSVDNLVIRATEKGSGAILAETEFR